MMMMSIFYSQSETGRKAWEVKGMAVFRIKELQYSDVGMGNVLSVWVEVA